MARPADSAVRGTTKTAAASPTRFTNSDTNRQQEEVNAKTGKNQSDDPRRELDDTAEFDVIPLFTDDLNGHDHDGDYPGDEGGPWFGRVVRRDPEP